MSRPAPPHSPDYLGPWNAQPLPYSRAFFPPSSRNSAFSGGTVFGSNAPVGIYQVTLMCFVGAAGTAGTLRMQVTCNGRDGGSTLYSLPAMDIAVANSKTAGVFAVDSVGTSDMLVSVIFAGVTVGALSYNFGYVVSMIDNEIP